MNVYEYLDRAKIYTLQHLDQRIGEAMMYCLREISPIAYYDIPEDVDPFYDDELVKSFIKYLISNWK
jgi:hypothetical protein